MTNTSVALRRLWMRTAAAALARWQQRRAARELPSWLVLVRLPAECVALGLGSCVAAGWLGRLLTF